MKLEALGVQLDSLTEKTQPAPGLHLVGLTDLGSLVIM